MVAKKFGYLMLFISSISVASPWQHSKAIVMNRPVDVYIGGFANPNLPLENYRNDAVKNRRISEFLQSKANAKGYNFLFLHEVSLIPNENYTNLKSLLSKNTNNLICGMHPGIMGMTYYNNISAALLFGYDRLGKNYSFIMGLDKWQLNGKMPEEFLDAIKEKYTQDDELICLEDVTSITEKVEKKGISVTLNSSNVMPKVIKINDMINILR